MLILTRRPGQTIRIGDDIEVHILSQDGYQTKVGITAPQGAGAPEGCIRTDQGGRDRTLNTNPATVPGF